MRPERLLRAGNLLVSGTFLLLVILSAGCTSHLPARGVHAVPDRVFLQDIPFYPQKKYQCGPASLAMLLDWNGADVHLSQLNEQVYSPNLKGSLQPSVIAAARRNGYLAYPIRGINALMTELSAGHPVMVLQNLAFSWIPRWHYAVVIGYDRNRDMIALHTGTRRANWLSAAAFASTWERGEYWGLLVLQPGVIPETATDNDYVSAVAGFERAGQRQAVLRAYRAAVEKWPESYIVRMGYGNSLYAGGYPGEAEAAFRKAASLRSDNGLALNNLAVILAERGAMDEALKIIEQAIEAGGDSRTKFIQTREEILAK